MCNFEWSLESYNLRLPDNLPANYRKGPLIGMFWQTLCSALYKETSKEKSISSLNLLSASKGSNYFSEWLSPHMLFALLTGKEVMW